MTGTSCVQEWAASILVAVASQIKVILVFFSITLVINVRIDGMSTCPTQVSFFKAWSTNAIEFSSSFLCVALCFAKNNLSQNV